MADKTQQFTVVRRQSDIFVVGQICAEMVKQDESFARWKFAQAVNALYNSSGGTLTLCYDEYSSPKDVKHFIRLIESAIHQFLGTIALSRHISIKNINPSPSQPNGEIQVSVKPSTKSEGMAVLKYNIYLPSNEIITQVSPLEEEQLGALLNENIPAVEPIKANAHKRNFVYGEHVSFFESSTIQFKFFRITATKNFTDCLTANRNRFSRHVSAFANFRGGHIYYGIQDGGMIEGQRVDEIEKKQIKENIRKVVNKMIWPRKSEPADENEDKRWDVYFEPVRDSENKIMEDLYIVVVFVAQCRGGVFVKEPECYEIIDNEVQKVDFVSWKQKFYPTKKGESAFYSEAYYQALKDGEEKNTRIPLMIVGNDRTGKTSLRKHLLGIPFEAEEPSTDGIEVDVVELTAENAKYAWKSKGKTFCTSSKEADEKLLENAAELISQEKLDPEDTPVSNDQGHQDFEAAESPDLSVKTSAPLTDEKVNKINEILSKEVDSEQSAPVRVFIHDFAGQSIFYDTHFCFLKMLCPYLLVVDASANLDEPAQPRFKFKSIDAERKLNDPFLETNADCLLSWLTVLAKLSDVYNDTLEIGDLEYTLPPTVIVLTNIDRCKGNIDSVVKRIKELRTHKAFQNVLSDIFLIDNKSHQRSGSEIKKLRELLYKLCTSILEKQRPMPVRWLQFEGVLSDMMLEKGVKHISVDDAYAKAEACNIENPGDAIRFLHNQGIILCHSESSLVVLNPPWLMNLFVELITVPQPDTPKELPLYQLLMSKGILKQGYLQKKVNEELIVDLMERFSLICPGEYEGECAYIVPSVAPLMEKGQDIQQRLSNSPIIPIYIQFNWSYVPLGYFTRFQTNMINRCRGELLTIPQIYCNYTLLSFNCTEGEFDVYLIKIPGKIKVGIIPRQNPDQQVYTVFVKSLKKHLHDSMKEVKHKEPFIYGNVIASLVVKCSVCCGKTEVCRLQHSHKVDCGRDDCCHFWQLEDLQNFEEDPLCLYNHETTSKFPLNRVKVWLDKGNAGLRSDHILSNDAANDGFLSELCECTGPFTRRLKQPDSHFEVVPRVFPIVLRREIFGTAFVFQTRDSRSYVVSWSSEKQLTCRMIVRKGSSLDVQRITLRHVAEESTPNLVTEGLPEQCRELVEKFQAVPSNDDQAGSKLLIVSRRAAHGCNDKPSGILTTKTSKICKVKRHKDGSYVRCDRLDRLKKRFKSYHVGAPLLNENDELVRMVNGFEKDTVSVLSVRELENLLKI